MKYGGIILKEPHIMQHKHFSPWKSDQTQNQVENMDKFFWIIGFFSGSYTKVASIRSPYHNSISP